MSRRKFDGEIMGVEWGKPLTGVYPEKSNEIILCNDIIKTSNINIQYIMIFN